MWRLFVHHALHLVSDHFGHGYDLSPASWPRLPLSFFLQLAALMEPGCLDFSQFVQEFGIADSGDAFELNGLWVSGV